LFGPIRRIVKLCNPLPKSKFIDVPEIEIKYAYELRPDMPLTKKDKEGNEVEIVSRKFCQELMDETAKGMLWTREQINGMENDMEVTFLPDIRNVWLHKGGWYRKQGTDTSIPYCRHLWSQVALKGGKRL